MTNADNLEALKQEVSQADLPLKDTATNLVFGKGNPDAKILFIGEAPGANEDLQGLPFVGAAGKQLDALLHTIGLCIDDVYIANILKYRPPNNRNPSVDEIRTHTPFLVKQIDAIQPKIIVTLGNFATKFVLAKFNVDDMKSIGGIMGLHGKEHHLTIDGRDYIVFPVFHPAAILYKPQWRQILTDDFKTLGELLKK